MGRPFNPEAWTKCLGCNKTIRKPLKRCLKCWHEFLRASPLNCPGNNGGVSVSRGYRYLKVSGHPFANTAGYVAEHRLVMEKVLGRYLNPKEVVHHKNSNRSDNRPENLEVLTSSTHMSLHNPRQYCKICGERSHGHNLCNRHYSELIRKPKGINKTKNCCLCGRAVKTNGHKTSISPKQVCVQCVREKHINLKNVSSLVLAVQAKNFPSFSEEDPKLL